MRARIAVAGAALLAAALLAGPPGTSAADTTQPVPTTERVSVAPDGSQVGEASWRSFVSDDGGVVAFASSAPDLLGGPGVFVRDRRVGTTLRVAGSGYPFGMSADGRVVGVDEWGRSISLVDRTTGARTDHPGARGLDVSADGCRALAFTPPDRLDVFDDCAGTVTTVDDPGHPYYRYGDADLSPDGGFVAYTGTDGLLLRDLTSGTVRQLRAGRIFEVSVSTGAAKVAYTQLWFVSPPDPSRGPLHLEVRVHDVASGSDWGLYAEENPNREYPEHFPEIDATGRWLVHWGMDGITRAVGGLEVRDLARGGSEWVTVPTGAYFPPDDGRRPSISAGGRYVSFESFSPLLVPGDTNDATLVGEHGLDVFLRDRGTVLSG